MPTSQTEGWLKIAGEFVSKLNFPNNAGSIDGKHVVFKAPPNFGSMYYNYKGTFSVVLLAVVDAGCNLVVGRE